MKQILPIAASPNTESDDVQLAAKLTLQPWGWKNKIKLNKFKTELSDKYQTKGVFDFDSARTSLMMIFKAYGIGPGDEVAILAFTCLVVANPIVWVGARPVFVDINPQTFNYDLQDLKKKMSAKVKAIVIQHSFGIPENIAEIRKIVGKEVAIIEDLAHALGQSSPEGELGTLGDAAIMTFGIEKVISGIRGGMAIVRDEGAIQKLTLLHSTTSEFPASKTFVALLNPIFWAMVLPIYNLGLGKLTLGRAITWLSHTLGLLGNMIEDAEYNGTKPEWMPSKMSGALGQLAYHQWQKLAKFSEHREKITKIYANELAVNYAGAQGLLRFPIMLAKRDKLVNKLKAQGIILGDWYKKILYAPQSTLDLLGYKNGDCPNAEIATQKIVNLPTFIKVTPEMAQRIAQEVKSFRD